MNIIINFMIPIFHGSTEYEHDADPHYSHFLSDSMIVGMRVTLVISIFSAIQCLWT